MSTLKSLGSVLLVGLVAYALLSVTQARTALDEIRPDTREWRVSIDVERGAQALQAYGCTACHTIPGIPGAIAVVGPSLEGLASRQTLAGTLANTPANQVAFLMDPQAYAPGSRMPALGVSEADAGAMVAYLATLR